ncbi:MAG TPA: hypothetical protein VGI79_19025 [Caulobacteraceae bacterium]|jgi:hypothetical protein
MSRYLIARATTRSLAESGVGALFGPHPEGGPILPHIPASFAGALANVERMPVVRVPLPMRLPVRNWTETPPTTANLMAVTLQGVQVAWQDELVGYALAMIGPDDVKTFECWRAAHGAIETESRA